MPKKVPSALATHELRLRLFGVLEAWSERRNPALAVTSAAARPADRPAEPSVWIFVSTIGELNAIEPFLMRLMAELGQPPLTLISDRNVYERAYLAKYPHAVVEQLDGSTRAVAALAARRPPLLLVVAEIPCLLHDAPCRFSYAAMHAARAAGAPVVMVNGWLYGYAPPSRLDRVERWLFGRDYVAGFDLMLVQTADMQARLVKAGAPAGRVKVAGNIKFDAAQPGAVPMAAASLQATLQARGDGPIIAAGSVTELEDQAAVLQAFAQLLARHPRAQLVLAPRHPEQTERMAQLKALLIRMGLDFRFRSACEPEAAASGSVLVLDTIGELRAAYAVARLTFVGVDHNVLEPLSFLKPVFVSGQWHTGYPSYPVYQQLLQAGALQRVERLEDLGPAWLAWLEGPDRQPPDRIAAALAAAGGATQRCMAALHEQLPALFTGRHPVSIKDAP